MKGADPLVSVIIPVFNGQAFIEETVRSIAQQSYCALEIVVVNDGSQDGTGKCLEALRPILDDWVPQRLFKIINQPNAGEAAAVNTGWAAAQGEFAAIVSADDPQPADWLSGCVAALLQHPEAAAAYPDWVVIGEDGRVLQEVKLPDFSQDELIAGARCLPGPGTLIRRRLAPAGALRRRDLRFGSDYESWLRLSLIAPFVHATSVKAQWREHAGSTSIRGNHCDRAKEYTQILRSFFDREDLPGRVRAMRSAAMASVHFLAARITWRVNPAVAARHLLAWAAYRSADLMTGQKWRPERFEGRNRSAPPSGR